MLTKIPAIFLRVLTTDFVFLFYAGSTVEVFTDTEGVFSGLMFQDNLMKSVFSSYPEVLLVDATYKLTDLKMPVYLMLCIDGNGQGEIVLVFLTAVETEEFIAKMVQAFKKFNSRWTQTNVVMSDKDFNERAVFGKNFLEQLCIFACFIRFEVSEEKLRQRSWRFDLVKGIMHWRS